MAEVKDKIITVESLKSKHDYDESTYLKKSGALTTLGITATATELNYADGVTSNIQTQLNNKFDKSGGTITGDTTINADLYMTDIYLTENGGAKGQIYGKTTSGDYVANLQPCNENDNCVIGFGMYNSGKEYEEQSGETNIYAVNGINMVLAGCTGRVFNARNNYGNMEINRSGHEDNNSKTYIYGTDVHLVTSSTGEAYKNNDPIPSCKVLYNNSTGTYGNLTLSESAANFDYLEVYVTAGNRYSSTKVCNPNGRTIEVHVHGGNNTNDWLFYGNWTVNGTDMSCTTNNTYAHSTSYTPTKTNELKIIKVVGYR